MKFLNFLHINSMEKKKKKNFVPITVLKFKGANYFFKKLKITYVLLTSLNFSVMGPLNFDLINEKPRNMR